MMLNGSLSRAYSIEDTLRFMTEAMDSYKQMLRRDIHSCRSRLDNHSEERHLQRLRLEHAFQDWLEDIFQEESSSRKTSLLKVSEIASEVNIKQAIPSSSASVMTNYGGSRFSYSSSVEHYHECELHQDNDIFYKNCSGEFRNHLSPLDYENSDKCRVGSWSDSGYCCDKSDSDYSRFSSLSFRGCFGEYDYSNQELEKLTYDNEDQYLESKLCINSDNLYHCDKNTGLEMPDIACYNEEEVKIFFELMNNPENFHETTKELSDMARDVKSKRQQPKMFSNIGRFFRNIVRNIRKCSENRSKLKAETKEIQQRDGRGNRRSSSLRSYPSPFQRRSSSVELVKKFRLPMKKSCRDTMKRASSYSSLFGRSGSLFAHMEQMRNFHIVKRSESCDAIQHKAFPGSAKNVLFDGVERNVDGFKTSCSTRDKSFQGLRLAATGGISSEDDSCCRRAQSSISCNGTCKQTQNQFIESELVAPLVINLNERRSAYTRRINKLKDIDFS